MTDTAAQPKLTPTFLKVRDALKAAVGRGWTVVPKSPGITCVRWTVEKPTPDHVTENRWPRASYSQHTFVNFVCHNGRVSCAIVRERDIPWVQSRDRKVSIKAALEILASH